MKIGRAAITIGYTCRHAPQAPTAGIAGAAGRAPEPRGRRLGDEHYPTRGDKAAAGDREHTRRHPVRPPAARHARHTLWPDHDAPGAHRAGGARPWTRG